MAIQFREEIQQLIKSCPLEAEGFRAGSRLRVTRLVDGQCPVDLHLRGVMLPEPTLLRRARQDFQDPITGRSFRHGTSAGIPIRRSSAVFEQ